MSLAELAELLQPGSNIIDKEFSHLGYNLKIGYNLKKPNNRRNIIDLNFIYEHYSNNKINRAWKAYQMTIKRLSLFHIYDGYLSAEYGSNTFAINEFVFIVNTINSELNFNLFYLADSEINSILSIIKLFEFMLDENLGSTYIYFGPPEHATALYIYKTEHFIKITYINTGEGFDINKSKYIEENGIKYYDILKTIYLPRNENIIKAFIHYLKPFIIYRGLHKQVLMNYKEFLILCNESFIHFDNVYIKNMEDEIPYFEIFNSNYIYINDYYSNIFNEVIKVHNREKYYKHINELFSDTVNDNIKSTFPELKKHIEIHEKEMSLRYEKFAQEWKTIDIYNENEYKMNYNKLAVDSFKHNFNDPNIYFALQQSGTCVFKSCMATFFLHTITVTPHISFPDIYMRFTDIMFNNLNNDIDETKQEIYKSAPDSLVIYNKLVSDNIISTDYDTTNIMRNNNIINVTNKDEEEYNIIRIDCGPSTEKFIILVNQIRNRTIDQSALIDLIVHLYTIDIDDDVNYIQRKNELLLLAILWEYYYERKKWTDTFKEIDEVTFKYDLFYKLFSSMVVRVHLNIDELIWIGKIHLRYVLQNKEDPKFYYNQMCNEFTLWKHISKKYDKRVERRIVGHKSDLPPIEPLIYNLEYNDINDRMMEDYIDGPSITPVECNEYLFIYYFIVNNIVDKIKLPETDNLLHYINISNLYTLPEMTNMLPHILNVFIQNTVYIENSLKKIYIYISVYLLFYQYFTLMQRYRIAKTIITTLKNNKGIIDEDKDYSYYYKFIYNILNLINVMSTKYYLINDILEYYEDLDTKNKESNLLLYTNYDKHDESVILTKVNVYIDNNDNGSYERFINNIFNIFNTTIVNNEEDIESLISNVISVIKLNITHKDITIEGNRIKYKYEDKIIDSEYKDITNNPELLKCPMIGYLFISNQDFRCLLTDDHLIVIINKYLYNYPLDDNLLIIFSYENIEDEYSYSENEEVKYDEDEDEYSYSENEEVKYDEDEDEYSYSEYEEDGYGGKSDKGMSIKLNDIVMINHKKYKYSDDYKQYPFLINAPKNCLNFISVTDTNITNSYKLISIFHTNNNMSFLKNSVNETSNNKYRYIELVIKPNMLTPVYDKINFNNIKEIRKYKYGEYIYKNIETNYIDIYMCEEQESYYPLDFNKLEDLFKLDGIIFYELQNIYESIINFKKIKKEKIEFIDWLNSIKGPFISKIIKTDEDGESNDCITQCDNKLTENKINEIIQRLELVRNGIIRKITFFNENIKSIIQFIKHNIKILSLLLQVNNILDNMIQLKKILNNCNELSCHDIYEINEMFSFRGEDMDVFEMIIELIFGRVLRQEQINRYRDMMQDYHNKKRSIYQFMMGKGKSSIITPLLYYNLTRYGEKVYIVVPSHLVKQTISTYYSFSMFMNNMPEIITDSDLKLKFLKNEYDMNAIYLFDEFDSMYNPLQSNFNIIMDMMPSFDEKKVNTIFTIAYDYITTNKHPIFNKYSMGDDIISILSNKSFIRNVSYGMSDMNKNMRVVIPYSRQDSPAEGSSFSSYMITILLTIKYFYNDNNFKIYNEDIDNILHTNKKLLKQIIDTLQLNIPSISVLSVDDIVNIMKEKYTEYIISHELFNKYLYILSNSVTRTKTIMNCSFIDIMQMPCIWQVGYSGTVNIDINVPKISNNINILQHYEPKISEDPDERRNVFTALHRYKYIEKLNNNVPEILNIISPKVDVIIDACAIFKNYSNEEIAKMIYNITKRQVIYLTKNDDMMLYNIDGISKFSYGALNNPVYYFSQRHTVGIDIMNQPTKLKGIVLLDDKNTYTQIAQAIYRMRKLNKGQTIMIGYVGDKKYTLSKEVYKMITDNDIQYQESYEPLLYLQYLKYYYRGSIKTVDNSQYVEKDLGLIYDVVSEEELRNMDKVIYKRLLKNVFNIDSDDINKINKFKENSLVLSKCLDYILSQKQDKLLELLYNVNTFTINTNIQQQMQQDIEEDQETDRIKQLTFNTYVFENIYSRLLPRTFYMYNPFSRFDEYVELNNTHKPIINNGITIFIPYNNIYINNLAVNTYENITHRMKFFIVMIDDKHYIIEPTKMLNHYINIMPLYSLTGYIINKISFPDIKNKIDINNILNFRVTTDYEEYSYDVNDFALLFNIMNDNINDIKMDLDDFIMYSMIYRCMQYGLTNITAQKKHINHILEHKIIPLYESKFNKLIEAADILYGKYIKSYYDNMDIRVPMTTVHFTLPKKRDLELGMTIKHLTSVQLVENKIRHNLI
jgi:hypothetical protein